MERTESAPPGRLERRKARTRAAILAAASELFTQQGYEGTSIAEIASRADTGVGTVYGYFPSKEDILLEVVKSWSEEAADEYAASMESAPSCLAQLTQALEARAHFVHAHQPVLMAAIEVSARSGKPSLRLEWLVAIFADVVRKGIASGEFRQVPVDATVRVLISSITMGLLRLGVWEEIDDDSALVRDIQAIARALLLP